MPTRRAILTAVAQLGALACAPKAAPPQRQDQPVTQPVTQPVSQPTPTLAVDLTHDIICPWCRIGHHNLEVALASWSGPAVAVNLHPYLLNPDLPAGGVGLRAYIAAKYGAANTDGMFARVTEVGRQYGLHFDFAKIDRIADTSPAHALVLRAPVAQQAAVLKALHKAHFEQGANPGDRAMLLAAWQTTGLPVADAAAIIDDAAAVAAVRQQALAAANQGLGGVPHFVVRGPAGQTAVHGGQPPAAFTAALRKVAG